MRELDNENHTRDLFEIFFFEIVGIYGFCRIVFIENFDKFCKNFFLEQIWVSLEHFSVCHTKYIHDNTYMLIWKHLILTNRDKLWDFSEVTSRFLSNENAIWVCSKLVQNIFLFIYWFELRKVLIFSLINTCYAKYSNCMLNMQSLCKFCAI